MSIGQAQLHPTGVGVLPQRYGSQVVAESDSSHKTSPSCQRTGRAFPRVCVCEQVCPGTSSENTMSLGPPGTYGGVLSLNIEPSAWQFPISHSSRTVSALACVMEQRIVEAVSIPGFHSEILAYRLIKLFFGQLFADGKTFGHLEG